MVEVLSNPWPWYIAGPLIALVMFLLIWFGENFGVSNNLRTLCVIGGGGKFSDFFRFKWKHQTWNLIFVVGAIVGGVISASLLSNNASMQISMDTQSELSNLGFAEDGSAYLPVEIFGNEVLTSVKGLFILIFGGFLVGFGARYAGGCTSGHAISGLSNLQIPSLISVVGFFIGGLIMVHMIMPIIFTN